MRNFKHHGRVSNTYLEAKFTASESNYGSMRSTLYSTGTTSSYYEEDATESLDFEETGNFASIISGVTDGVDDEGKKTNSDLECYEFEQPI